MPEFHMIDKDDITFQNLDQFTQGYIECLFFTENSPQTSTEEFMANYESGDNDGCVPSDVGFTDIVGTAIEHILYECAEFQRINKKLLGGAYELEMETKHGTVPYEPHQAGIDFWFTRNGHGVGFWDRGLGKIGEDLSKACGHGTEFSESYVEFGDNKKVYVD